MTRPEYFFKVWPYGQTLKMNRKPRNRPFIYQKGKRLKFILAHRQRKLLQNHKARPILCRMLFKPSESSETVRWPQCGCKFQGLFRAFDTSEPISIWPRLSTGHCPVTRLQPLESSANSSVEDPPGTKVSRHFREWLPKATFC